MILQQQGPFFLQGIIQTFIFINSKKKREFFDPFFRIFTSIRFLYTKGKPEEAVKKFFRIEAKHKRTHEILCLFLPNSQIVHETIKKYEKTYSFLQTSLETTKLPKERFKKNTYFHGFFLRAIIP